MPYIPTFPRQDQFAGETLTKWLSLVGAVLWIIVYFVIVRAGFLAHSYGIPALAICLNITWEFIFSFVFPPESKVARAIYVAWFLLDCIVLYQLFSYGGAEQTIPEIQRGFPLLVAGIIVLAFIFHYTFHKFSTDPDGGAAAYIINLVMSVLFAFLLFARRDQHALSHCAAWLKMLGTGLMSLSDLIRMFVTKKPIPFMIFLYLSTFLFDVIYLFLIYAS